MRSPAKSAAFAAALVGDPGHRATAHDATQALQVALAAERSFRERRVVRVDEIE